ncbi:MAG: hypothetical protein V4708_17465 [Bacteroidota bacterium]
MYNTTAGIGVSGSGCFATAIGLETSNGMEVSGLNAAQMSEIQFRAVYTKSQVCGASNEATLFTFFVHYDSMITLKANNVVTQIS